MAKQRKKKHVGEIYYVDPKHLVKSKDWNKYKKSKGNNPNPRPVMVGIENSSKKVQVSQMYSKASPKQVSRNQRIKMDKTYPKKSSYVDTNTMAKSKSSNKKFKIGEDPLLTPTKKADSKDINKYQQSRKKRGR
jgi:hypothetical protein